MKNNDKRKLDAISGIDEKIVDEATSRRVVLSALLKKKKSARLRKRIAITGSAAASLVLVFTILLTVVVPLFSRDVPVYTGMSASGDFPTLGGSATVSIDSDAPHYLSNSTNLGDVADKLEGIADEAGAGELFDAAKEFVKDYITVTPPTVSEQTYYVEPQEFVYITVHINNPANYEILSFTLNGVKYSSYMFEKGSDMENLVLKVELNGVGIHEFTIDAIKYVDGTLIRDVRMEGNRTITVAAVAKVHVPSIHGSLASVGESLTARLVLTDELGLIDRCNGTVLASLYEDGELIDVREIALGKNNLEYTVERGKWYNLVVVGEYDAMRGDGPQTVLLWEKKIVADPIQDISVDEYEGVYESIFKIEVRPCNDIVSKVISVWLEDEYGNVTMEFDEPDGFYEDNTATYDVIGAAGGKYRIAVKYEYQKDGKTVNETRYSEERFVFSATRPIKDATQITAAEILASKYDVVRIRQTYISERHQDDGIYAPISGTVVEVRHNTITFACGTAYRVKMGLVSVQGMIDDIAVGDSVQMGQRIGTGTGDKKEIICEYFFDNTVNPRYIAQILGVRAQDYIELSVTINNDGVTIWRYSDFEIADVAVYTPSNFKGRPDDEPLEELVEFEVKDNGSIFYPFSVEYKGKVIVVFDRVYRIGSGGTGHKTIVTDPVYINTFSNLD